MLTPEKAMELDKRINKRLDEEIADDSLKGMVRRAAVRVAVLAIQEYERMKEEDQNS